MSHGFTLSLSLFSFSPSLSLSLSRSLWLPPPLSFSAHSPKLASALSLSQTPQVCVRTLTPSHSHKPRQMANASPAQAWKAPSESGTHGSITPPTFSFKFALHQALNEVRWGELTFDERVALHRVDPAQLYILSKSTLFRAGVFLLSYCRA